MVVYGPDFGNAVLRECGKGLQLQCSHTARSAVAAVAVLNDGYSPDSAPHVSKLLRGVFREKPSLPRYNEMWDVKVLLDHFGTTGLTALNLKTMTCKLAAMLVLF